MHLSKPALAYFSLILCIFSEEPNVGKELESKDQNVNQSIILWRQLSFEEKKQKLDIWLQESAPAKAQWIRNQTNWQYLSQDEKSQRIENFLTNNQKARKIWEKYWMQWFQMSSEARHSQVEKWLELNPEFAQKWKSMLEEPRRRGLSMDEQWLAFLKSNPSIRSNWDGMRNDFLKAGAGSAVQNWTEFLNSKQEIVDRIKSEMATQWHNSQENTAEYKDSVEREVRSKVEAEVQKRVEQGIRESMQNREEWLNLTPSQRAQKIREIKQKYMDQNW